MSLFSLQAQQDGQITEFNILDLLDLIDPANKVNDEIIIRNKIYKRSSFKAIAEANMPVAVTREEVLLCTDGQIVFQSSLPISDPANLKVVLNGLELQQQIDYEVQNSSVIMGYPMSNNALQADLLKLIHP